MLDPPPKFKPKPIPIPAVLLKCPEIQAFPALLATQGTHGGIRVPVPMNEFVDCVKFVHDVRTPKADLGLLETSSAGGGGTIGRGSKKYVPKGAKQGGKDIVGEAAEKLLEKVCEATTKAPVGGLEEEDDEKEDRPSKSNSNLIRELETVKASVTRIVDQMDKKLDCGIEAIREQLAAITGKTLSSPLQIGVGPSWQASRSTAKEDCQQSSSLSTDIKDVASSVKELNSHVDMRFEKLFEEVCSLRTEVTGMREEGAVTGFRSLPVVASAEMPSSDTVGPIMAIQTQNGAILDAICALGGRLSDIHKSVTRTTTSGSDLKMTASRDIDKILSTITNARDRILQEKSKKGQNAVNVDLLDKVLSLSDDVKRMEALVEDTAISLDAAMAERSKAAEGLLETRFDTFEERVLLKLEAMENRFHPEELPDLNSINRAVFDNVNKVIVLHKLDMVAKGAFQSVIQNATPSVIPSAIPNQARLWEPIPQMLVDDRQIDKFVQAAERKICEPVAKLVLAASSGHTARVDEVKAILITMNNRLLAVENKRPPELFQIDTLFRNHLGGGFEDLKHFFAAGLDSIPKRGEPVATAGSILGRVDTTLADIKRLLKEHCESSNACQAENGIKKPKNAAIEIKASPKMFEDSCRTAVGPHFKALDDKLAGLSNQLVQLGPASGHPSAADLARLLEPLSHLSQLDGLADVKTVRGIEGTVQRCITQSATKSTGTVISKLDSLVERLKNLNKAAHDTDEHIKGLTEKTGKITKAVHEVDKRVYNTEVRLYELKPPLRDSAAKMNEATDEILKLMRMIRSHEDNGSKFLISNGMHASVAKLLETSIQKVATPVGEINYKLGTLTDDLGRIRGHVNDISAFFRLPHKAHSPDETHAARGGSLRGFARAISPGPHLQRNWSPVPFLKRRDPTPPPPPQL